MRLRQPLAIITLLLFVAPLGASICGDCGPGHCLMTDAPEMSDSGEARAEVPEAESPCHAAMGPQAAPPKPEPAERDTAPCHSATPAVGSSDCCSMAAVPGPELASSAAGSVVFELSLEPASDTAELPDSDQGRLEKWRQQPPRQVPQPIYALNSAFLI